MCQSTKYFLKTFRFLDRQHELIHVIEEIVRCTLGYGFDDTTHDCAVERENGKQIV